MPQPPSSSTLTPDGLVIPGETGTVIPNAPPAGSSPSSPPVSPAPSVTPAAETPPNKVDVTPPTEPAEEPDDFTAFLDAKNIATIPEPKKKADDVPPTGSKPNVQPAAPNKPAARDYSDLPEEDRPLFEKMSNDAYNKLKPQYLEYLALKSKIPEFEKQIRERDEKLSKAGSLPDSWQEHPNSFVLTPEFEQGAKTVQIANRIVEHWASQLQAVEEGEETYRVVQLDEKTGELVTSQELPVDKATRTNLIRYMQFAQTQADQKQQELRQIAASHQSKYKEALGWVDNFEKSSFKYFEQPDNPLNKVVEATIEEMPAAFRKSPLARPFAKALVTIQQLAALVKQSKTAAPAAPAKEQKLAGPTLQDVGTGGGSSKSDGDVTLDDFIAAKNVYMTPR